MTTTDRPAVPVGELPWSIAEFTAAARDLLGPEWHAQPGSWGMTGILTGPRLSCTVGVGRGGLYVDPDVSDADVATVYRPDVHARDGRAAVAAVIADAVRELL